MGGEHAGLSEFTQLPCGAYEATLDDDSSLRYYFNCPDALGVPREVLDDVTALYVHGYETDVGLIDLLPNASYVYSTALCVGAGIICGSCSKPFPPEIDECYWDDESDEFVVNARDEYSSGSDDSVE